MRYKVNFREINNRWHIFVRSMRVKMDLRDGSRKRVGLW